MQTNSATIEELGILSELVYANRYFSLVDRDIIINQSDDDRLSSSYTVLGVSTDFNYDSGFQGLLLKNDTTNDYVFAFRGTEINHGWDEFKKDLIVADIAYMGTNRAPQQMKDAMSFVQEMKLAHSSINAFNTVFTGHSLGGSIAGMASYVYGFEAYTYNGFGINNMIWDADDTSTEDNPKEMGYEDPLDIEDPQLTDIYQTLGEHLESLGVTVQKETNKITNIIQVGYSKPDLVGSLLTDIISGQTGETHFVLNHTGNQGGFIQNHDKKILNESISIFNNLTDVLSDEDYDSLTEKLFNVAPDDKQVERFLKALSTLTGAVDSDDHVTLAENIKSTGISDLSLISCTTRSEVDALDGGYKKDLFSLLNALPFTIEGNDSLFDNVPALNEIYSATFIEDRKDLIYYCNNPNDQPILFDDKEFGILLPEGSGYPPSKYIFGSKGNDSFQGDQRDDHLYGMQGNDTLIGNGGNDNLEGGRGYDLQNLSTHA